MLLLNRTLIKMAKGLWGWILTITGLKLVTLVGMTYFVRTISAYLGNLDSPAMGPMETKSAVFSALIAALVMLAAELLTGEAEYRCTAKARQSLRTQIFSKTLELDVGNIEKIGPVSAITSSVDGVESMQIYYSEYLPGLFYCLIAPIYLFFQMYPYSHAAATVLFFVSITLMPINNVFRKHIEVLKTDYWNSLEDLTGYYLESVQGLSTLKLFNQDERRTEGLQKKSDDFNHKVMSMMLVNFRSFLLTDGLIYGAVTAAFLIACVQLGQGRISFSSALTVLMLAFGFFGSIRQLMGATHSALAGIAAAEKVADLLAIDTTRPYLPNTPAEKAPFPGISLRDISYAYEGRKASLSHIDMEIPRGKTTALVGLSGCGKSTAAGMLMKFFDPETGKIYLDGRDYTSFTPEELRKNIVMVPQTVNLFSGTLAENLRMAAPAASDEELIRVLSDVHLKGWLDEQPHGLNTDVGDAGGRLSGGQRQKVGIARALLCHTEYIIFDEATSSVDMESEREIWHCIGELATTKTLIIISHRLSTIRSADKIYVMSEGKVAGCGTHDTLIKKDGLYRKLVEEQNALENQEREDESDV